MNRPGVRRAAFPGHYAFFRKERTVLNYDFGGRNKGMDIYGSFRPTMERVMDHLVNQIEKNSQTENGDRLFDTKLKLKTHQ